MSRPSKDNYIKLDVAERMNQNCGQEIQIEHLKDYITKEKIIEFSAKAPIAFSQLKNTKCSHTANHWLDYWIESGMLRNIFNIGMPQNGGEYYRYHIDGMDNLLKTPRYALIYLCLIMQNMFDDENFASYIDYLFLRTTEFQKPDKNCAEEVFAEKRLRFGTYWLLLEKAVDAWEKDSLEIDYLKDELDEFDYLLRNYWEDYIKKSSSEMGRFDDKAFDGLYKEDEDDDYMLQKSLAEIGIPYNFEQSEEENISVECFSKEKITFEKFSNIIASLFSREDNVYGAFEHNKSSSTNGFFGTRSVRFAPYLGPFFIGLNRCYKKFPFNPQISILDEGAKKKKRVRCPEPCIELMTSLQRRGDEKIHCPEPCVKIMKSSTDMNYKSGNVKAGKDFRKKYSQFCEDFLRIIMQKDQMYQVGINPEKCINSDDLELYQKCIIYIFEEVFAYSLFIIESKATVLELIEHAIKKIEEETAGRAVDVDKIKEEVERLYWRMEVGTYGELMRDIYQNNNIHTRAKVAPIAIKRWVDINRNGEDNYEFVEPEIISFNCAFFKEMDKDQQKSFMDIILNGFDSEIDKYYQPFEEMASKSECEINEDEKTERWNDIVKEICDAIRQIDDEIGKILVEKEKDWITILYDEVSYWVVKASLNLKEIELD